MIKEEERQRAGKMVSWKEAYVGGLVSTNFYLYRMFSRFSLIGFDLFWFSYH